MVFVYYQFNPSPLNFNPLAEEAGMHTASYVELQKDLEINQQKKAEVSLAFAITDNPSEKAAFKEEIKYYNQKEVEIRTKAGEIIQEKNQSEERRVGKE